MSTDSFRRAPHPGLRPRAPVLSRRRLLDRVLTAGACSLAAPAVALRERLVAAAELGEAHPLAPRATHFPPTAQRLLVVFLTGGFSHLDTFDPKPRLTADHGKLVRADSLRDVTDQPLLASPFRFQQHGQSGLWISELFPHLARHADDLCVIRSLHTDIVEHFQATLAMHTGSATVPLPSLGAWVSYALGTFNANLPSYVVLAEHLPYAGAQVWDHSFLPPDHQGVRIVPGPDPIPNLSSPTTDTTLAALSAQMLDDVNEQYARLRPEDLRLPARRQSFATARGLMREAPEIFDVARESAGTLAAYGVAAGDRQSFAWQCLTARRLLERGVRVVELIDTGSHDNWDAHGNMQDHRPKAARVDQPLAALLADLKNRGLLADTLVVICTEFGRTPWANNPGGQGRNHFARAFTSLLAGAGVRGGLAYGETDDYGAAIVADPCHVHDYHATILHLLGLDHRRVTYRYAGRDFRLTDVAGEVLGRILS